MTKNRERWLLLDVITIVVSLILLPVIAYAAYYVGDGIVNATVSLPVRLIMWLMLFGALAIEFLVVQLILQLTGMWNPDAK